MDPISFRPDVMIPGTTTAVTPAPGGKSNFSTVFAGALDDVNASQRKAEVLTREFQLDNPKVGLEETMVAVQKANISFQAVLQVRNKLVAAYQDIMNMQV